METVFGLTDSMDLFSFLRVCRRNCTWGGCLENEQAESLLCFIISSLGSPEYLTPSVSARHLSRADDTFPWLAGWKGDRRSLCRHIIMQLRLLASWPCSGGLQTRDCQPQPLLPPEVAAARAPNLIFSRATRMERRCTPRHPVPEWGHPRVTCWLVINGILTGNRTSCCVSSPPPVWTTPLSVLLVIPCLGVIVIILLMIRIHQSRDYHMPQGALGLKRFNTYMESYSFSSCNSEWLSPPCKNMWK